jgi:multimeric flavodoxin WrbA
MKVLAFNGSPKKDKGNTAVILAPFLDGLRQAGAEVELFYTKDLDINPCQGEFNCWLKTPGHCHQEDDMQKLHPKLRAADVWVFATPVYVWGVAGPLKNLMDRILPVLQPFITLRDGHCSHPLGEGTKPAKIVLVANCGFWEMDNFDPLLAQMKAFCRILGFEFAGALLRPHGSALRAMLEMGAPVDDVLDAARRAGRELVRNGHIGEGTELAVSRILLPLETYIEFANREFQAALERVQAAAGPGR